MQFDLTQSSRGNNSGQWKLEPPSGQLVCYQEKTKTFILRKTSTVLSRCDWHLQFAGYFYSAKTRHGFIQEEIPASSYFSIAWFEISRKYHATKMAFDACESQLLELETNYRLNRKFCPPFFQPEIAYTSELYNLGRELTSLLFHIRSILDQIASLVQFLTGPKARQYSSFARLMMASRSTSDLPEVPPELRSFLSNSCEWFWKLRDLRDYLAHKGYVKFTIFESEGASPKFYIHERIPARHTAIEFMSGLDGLLRVFDDSYSERIEAYAETSVRATKN